MPDDVFNAIKERSQGRMNHGTALQRPQADDARTEETPMTAATARPLGTFAVAARGVLGAFTSNHLGWRFIPWCQHSPSRKHWESPEEALPRWASDASIIRAESAKDALAMYRATHERVVVVGSVSPVGCVVTDFVLPRVTR